MAARRKRTIEATNMPVGQDRSLELPATGPVGDIEHDIEPVSDGPQWKDKAAQLAFMNEELEINIMQTGAVNEEPVVQLGNNGRNQFVIRGQWQKVKRKYVEVLARSKRERVRTEEYTDGNGDNATKIVINAGLKYPFSVRNDPNPKGKAWLEKVLAEA